MIRTQTVLTWMKMKVRVIKMVRTLYKIVSICAYISYSFIYAFVDMDVDNDGASDLSVQNREILLEVSQKRKKLERLQKKVITSYCC